MQKLCVIHNEVAGDAPSNGLVNSLQGWNLIASIRLMLRPNEFRESSMKRLVMLAIGTVFVTGIICVKPAAALPASPTAMDRLSLADEQLQPVHMRRHRHHRHHSHRRYRGGNPYGYGYGYSYAPPVYIPFGFGGGHHFGGHHGGHHFGGHHRGHH